MYGNLSMAVLLLTHTGITIFAAKSNDILIIFQLISYAFLPNWFLIFKQDFLNKNNIDYMLCIKLAVYSKTKIFTIIHRYFSQSSVDFICFFCQIVFSFENKTLLFELKNTIDCMLCIKLAVCSKNKFFHNYLQIGPYSVFETRWICLFRLLSSIGCGFKYWRKNSQTWWCLRC